MRPALAWALALAAVAAGATACGSDGGGSEAAAALTAARAYVAAIAARDLDGAEAMTDPTVLRAPTGRDAPADIRSALPQATDPITDPWVAPEGRTTEPPFALRAAGGGGTEPPRATYYVFAVSYAVKGLTGGDDIALRLRPGGDPDRVSDWVVSDPLIVRTDTFADVRDVAAGTVGDVRVDYPSYGYRPLWGYPGGYRLTAAPGTAHRAQVEPLWVAVGAADGPGWHDFLPQLHRGDRP